MKIQENVNKQLRKKSENKKASGITLIALVITIIVLLILAGVTIAMLTGENGILTRASGAKTETEIGKIKEEVQLAITELIIEDKGKKDNITPKKIVDKINGEYNREGVTATPIDTFPTKIKYPENIIIDVDENLNVNIGDIGKTEETEAPKVTDTNPGILNGTGVEADPFKIESIEDLVAFSNNVNSGISYESQYVNLEITLDFNSDNSYINSSRIDYGDINGDGVTEGLKIELTKRTGRTGDYQEGFISIGSWNDEYQEDLQAYKGAFNGKNNKIKNMYQSRGEIYSKQGLFNCVTNNAMGEKGKIENLTVTGEIKSISNNKYTYTSGIATKCDGIVENCISEINIDNSKNTYTSGIVGCGTAKIINCINNGNIKGSFVAGIYSGRHYSEAPAELINCINNGNLEGVGVSGIGEGFELISGCINKGDLKGEYVGGIIGEGSTSNTWNPIKDCINEGDITALASVLGSGGIIGNTNYAYLENCINRGNIKGIDQIGGLVGYEGYISEIKNSYNYGDISGTGEYVGGLAGDAGIIHIYNSGNYGNISGVKNIGGVIGGRSYEVKINNVFNYGNIIGTGDNIGGIIGEVNGASVGYMKNSYNSGNVEGINNIGGIVGFDNSSYEKINMYNSGKVKGNQTVGGIVGKDEDYGGGIFDKLYNLGQIQAIANSGGIFGQLEGTQIVKNSKYLEGTATGGVNGIEQVGIERANFTKTDLLQYLNSAVDSSTDTGNEKLSRWKIEETKNNGFPIFE